MLRPGWLHRQLTQAAESVATWPAWMRACLPTQEVSEVSATHKVTCDSCGADLTSTAQMPRFRLAMHAEALPHIANTIYAVHVEPPLCGSVHFCNFGCLKSWLDKEHPGR